jgi:polar amino acid transport system substrate-binding protein
MIDQDNGNRIGPAGVSRRARLCGLLATVLAVGLAHPARADQLDDIRRRGVLVVGVLGTDEPQSFIELQTRTFVGYEVDLARAVAERIGVKVEFKQLSVAARIPELRQGRVDLLAASLTHTVEREAQIDFSVTTFVTGQKVMVKVSSGITDVAQLTGKKVLTVKGGTQEPNIRKAVPGVEVVNFENTQQALLALQQGKGVGYVNDEASLVNDAAKLGAAREAYAILPTNLSVEPLALGLRKGEPRLKAEVDAALRALEASGRAEALYQRWFGASSRLRLGPRSFKLERDTL